MVDAHTVRRWIEQAEAECAARTRALDSASYQLAEAKRRLTLLHELLASVDGGPGVPTGTEATLSTAERVERDVAEILRGHGRPMRIQDIHTEFVRRSLPLPGRGTPTNIVAHLTNSNVVKRVARGVYGLAKWVGDGQQLDESAEKKEAVTSGDY